jgi:hypothetical protein
MGGGGLGQEGGEQQQQPLTSIVGWADSSSSSKPSIGGIVCGLGLVTAKFDAIVVLCHAVPCCAMLC